MSQFFSNEKVLGNGRVSNRNQNSPWFQSTILKTFQLSRINSDWPLRGRIHPAFPRHTPAECHQHGRPAHRLCSHQVTASLGHSRTNPSSESKEITFVMFTHTLTGHCAPVSLGHSHTNPSSESNEITFVMFTHTLTGHCAPVSLEINHYRQQQG